MRYREITNEAAPGSNWAYHGTLHRNMFSIVTYGLQSQRRVKWSPDDSNKRMFNLLYFTLQGPDGWGAAQDDYTSVDALMELRFPLAALRRVKWEEDDAREGRDEYHAVSRKDFSISPELIEVLHGSDWMPLKDYMQNVY